MLELNKKKEAIRAYGAPRTLAVIDEKSEDIKFAIKYYKYGDDFILVEKNDGTQYLYGYFLNGPMLPLESADAIRETVFNNGLTLEGRVKLESKLCKAYEDIKRMFKSPTMKKYAAKHMLDALEKAYSSNIMYDFSSFISFVETIAKENGMSEDESVQELLYSDKWFHGIDGLKIVEKEPDFTRYAHLPDEEAIAGNAGKLDITSWHLDDMSADAFIWIFQGGNMYTGKDARRFGKENDYADFSGEYLKNVDFDDLRD